MVDCASRWCGLFPELRGRKSTGSSYAGDTVMMLWGALEKYFTNALKLNFSKSNPQWTIWHFVKLSLCHGVQISVFVWVCVCFSCMFVRGPHLLVTFGNTSYNSCVSVSELIAVNPPDPSRIKSVIWQSAPQAQEPFYLSTLMLH